jgi:transposase
VLDKKIRNTILTLAKKKIPQRKIARLLKISRGSVSAVIDSKSSEPKTLSRKEKAEPYRDEILELHQTCQGNLVRIHEELLSKGAKISYPALTAFCRRQGIGTTPKERAGRYHFEPGQEMQHDTSPHQAEIGGKMCKIQTASAVLCYSRMLFFQGYPRFRRFECKLFLTEALRYFQGAPKKTMIDNTHVVILRGTGKDMIPTAEMEAFAERYGMLFHAHAVGDANRKGRVERPFHYIENNFLAGRTFADWDDFNRQARAWCDAKNRLFKRHLKAVPIELYNVERTQLLPLPVWVPEPYLLHERIVDVHGYVTLDTNRYSAPADWIGKSVQVQESAREITITARSQQGVVTHQRHPVPEEKWITLPEHRRQRKHKKGCDPPRELAVLLRRAPELESYVKTLRKHVKRSFGFALRQILRMLDDYPRQPLLDAVRDAEHYALYDIERLETMVLQRIDRDFFPLENIGEQDD